MEKQMDPDLQKLLVDIARKRSALTPKPSGASGPTRSPAGTDAREREKRIHTLELAGINKRYQGITFESIERRGLPSDPDIRRNYRAVRAYAEDIQQNVKRGYGLILAGNYGTLKTTMAVAVMRHWMSVQEGGCLMVPMCSLIDNLFTMRALSKEEWARYERRIRSTPLLVLDDLGGESIDQGWVLSKVDSIITERYNKMLPIIVTTNLSKEELAGTYSGRIMDRLRNTSQCLVFTGVSQRKVRA